MKFKLTVLFCLICAFGIAQGRFYECKLFFENGNKVEGFAKFPTNISMDDDIKYKKSLKDDEIIKIDKNKLEEIIYYTEDNKTYFFINTPFLKTFLKSNNKIETKKFRRYWLVKTLINDKLMAYMLSQNYKIDKRGILVGYSSNNIGMGKYAIVYLVKRPEEDYPTMISFRAKGYINKGDKFFRRTAMAYFKDDKALLKRIKNKEFTLEGYGKLINEYCDCQYSFGYRN